MCSVAVTPKLSGLTFTINLWRGRPTDGLLRGVRPSPAPPPPPPVPPGGDEGLLGPPAPGVTGGGVLFKPPLPRPTGVDVEGGGASDGVGFVSLELLTLFRELFNTLSR